MGTHFEPSNFDTDGIQVQLLARCRKAEPDLRMPTSPLPSYLYLIPGVISGKPLDRN